MIDYPFDDQDEGHDRVLVSLDRGFNPAAPVGADLATAFVNLVDQAFRSMYPAPPVFEQTNEPVRPRELTLVASYVERLSPTRTVGSDGPDRPRHRAPHRRFAPHRDGRRDQVPLR